MPVKCFAPKVTETMYHLIQCNLEKKNKMNCELMLTYDTPALRQTGNGNLTGQKTLPQYGVPI